MMDAHELIGSDLYVDDVYSVSVQAGQPSGTVCRWVEDDDKVTDSVAALTDLMVGHRFGVMMEMAKGVDVGSAFEWTYEKHCELDPTETLKNSSFREVFRELRQVVMVCRYPGGPKHIGSVITGSIHVRFGESIECAHVILHPVIQSAINAKLKANE
tara:strand:+ start:245 stop:715 length:471 start_codon:yes stop_codon:yes gene_type:complete